MIIESLWCQDTYIRACQFAAHAHQNQYITGTKLPYLLHINLVTMELMTALSHHPNYDGNFAIQCALLHDVIEDTQTTYQQIHDHFGKKVAQGVLALSKDTSLPKTEQMQDSLQRICQQPTEVWMVKLADRITNLQKPPEFWNPEKIHTYRIESLEILNRLGTASDFLAARLQSKIDHYLQYI